MLCLRNCEIGGLYTCMYHAIPPLLPASLNRSGILECGELHGLARRESPTKTRKGYPRANLTKDVLGGGTMTPRGREALKLDTW